MFKSDGEKVGLSLLPSKAHVVGPTVKKTCTCSHPDNGMPSP